MSFPCPVCHDSHTKSLALVYDQGVSTNLRGERTRINMLSAKCLPPEEKSSHSWAIILSVVCIMTTSSIVVAIGLADIAPQEDNVAALSSQPAPPANEHSRSHHAAAAKSESAASVKPFLPGGSAVPTQNAASLRVWKAFSLIWLLLGAVAVVAIRNILSIWRYNNTVWPELQRNWASTFMCMSCGNTFTPSQNPEP